MKHLPIHAAAGLVLASVLFPFSPVLLAANPPAKAVAPAKAQPLTPGQLRQRVNENNNKVRAAIRELDQACRNAKKLGDKLPGKVAELTTTILAFPAIPEAEGRPDAITLSSAHRQIGEALADPINLRLIDQAQKHLEEAKRLAKTEEEKAEASFALASFRFRSGRADDLDKCRKEMAASFETAGLSVPRRLDLLKKACESGIDPDLDFVTLGWKIAEPEHESHWIYYNYALRLLKTAGWNQNLRLEAKHSGERAVEICERALRDPAIRDKRFYLESITGELVNLRRPAEAEQILLSNAATTNANDRHHYSLILGDFYKEQAKRYYDEPYAPLMEKAIAAYTDAGLAWPKDSNSPRKIGATALEIGDYDRAIASFEKAILLEQGKTNRWVAVPLGDAYYGKKDWARATTCYGLSVENLPLPSLMRHCKALYALGRFEETLENLKRYEKRGYSSQKDEARFLIRNIEGKLAARPEEP